MPGGAVPHQRDPGKGPLSEGFTLIEILVVMSIMILVFGIMIPSVRDYMKNLTLKDATGRLGRALVMARNLAVTDRVDHQVVFYREGLYVWSPAKGYFEYSQIIPPGKKENVRYNVRFAGDRGLWEDLLPRPLDQDDLLQKGVSAPRPARDMPRLLFRRDGTIEFPDQRPGDRGGYLFQKDRPDGADLDIYVAENPDVRGFVDIDPSGGVDFKIAAAGEALLEEDGLR